MWWSQSLMQHWSAPKLFMTSSSQSLFVVASALNLFMSFLIQQLAKFQAFLETNLNKMRPKNKNGKKQD